MNLPLSREVPYDAFYILICEGCYSHHSPLCALFLALHYCKASQGLAIYPKLVSPN